MKDVVFVTGNPNKAKYLADLIGMDIDHHAVELDEIQSMDLKMVTLHKAMHAYGAVGRPVLVEDQGMFLPALDGFPGPFIKFLINNGKNMLNLVKILNGFDDRTAISRTVFVYYDGTEAVYFEGELRGEIATEPKGDGGFGWDPVFKPDGYGGKTRAELTKDEDHATYLVAKPIAAVGAFLRGA